MTPQNLEDIHTVVVHCSATHEGKWIDAKMIDAFHKKRGFSMIGYHRLIRLDGSVEQGRKFNQRGAHVKGDNTNTIGICLVGGLNPAGKPKDTFNDDQYHALMAEIHEFTAIFPNLKKVCGHRDFSPDLNGDGIITRNEWIKECPCIEISDKLKEWGLERFI